MANLQQQRIDQVTLAADVAVWRALEVAGKRLLTRDRRSQYQNVPPWLLHTQIRVDDADLDRLLTGAWTCLRQALAAGRPAPGGLDYDRLIETADEYVRALLRSGTPHELRWLVQALRQASTADSN
ncbi:hypothetical protein [Microtetraspora malaysiensis]|uniref:Uncharacterized protein n=1 Tax=Microtetraspora malaysiensis TaxID=161358 RepID=A0ABW6SKG0_9ACTN